MITAQVTRPIDRKQDTMRELSTPELDAVAGGFFVFVGLLWGGREPPPPPARRPGGKQANPG